MTDKNVAGRIIPGEEPVPPVYPSLEDRQREKQASRDKDAQDLASGRKSREQLRKENSLIRIASIDWDHVKPPR